jgi:hypothetical protein
MQAIVLTTDPMIGRPMIDGEFYPYLGGAAGGGSGSSGGSSAGGSGGSSSGTLTMPVYICHNGPDHGITSEEFASLALEVIGFIGVVLLVGYFTYIANNPLSGNTMISQFERDQMRNELTWFKPAIDGLFTLLQAISDAILGLKDWFQVVVKFICWIFFTMLPYVGQILASLLGKDIIGAVISAGLFLAGLIVSFFGFIFWIIAIIAGAIRICFHINDYWCS